MNKQLVIACIENSITLANAELDCFSGECSEDREFINEVILRLQEQILIISNL